MDIARLKLARAHLARLIPPGDTMSNLELDGILSGGMSDHTEIEYLAIILVEVIDLLLDE